VDTQLLNGLAGLAALVNSALMWPTIKSLRAIVVNLDTRVTRLEAKPKRRRR
jgi:hypothetical protein